jgi:hypothetical protein
MTAPKENEALSARLRQDAKILDRHPCEVYALNSTCREAADALDALESDNRQLSARIQELEGAILNYLSEYDNPAPDYAYRHHLRECLRAALNGGDGK